MRNAKSVVLCLVSTAVVLGSPIVCAGIITKVITVPWQGDPLKYHTTISGQSVWLKGVIKTSTTGNIWYKWVYGDGSESAVTAKSGATKYIVEAARTYTGAAGTPFIAQLRVAENSAMVDPVIDNYLVKIETTGLDAKINIAIDNGLWYLYKQGTVSTGGSGSYRTLDSSPCVYWSYSYYYASPTASAVHAFEINGHKETGNFDEDPYAEYVKWGLNWLLRGYYSSTTYLMLQTVTISTQHGDNPDSRPNGKGIQCRDYGDRPIYQGGMVMDAIIASGTPGASSGRDFDGDGANETYQQVVQDMIDMYAYGQYDGTSGGLIIGGWRYSWDSFPDNSACQWAAIGMIPAQESPWNCTVPAWVKTYDNNWLNYSYLTPVAGNANHGGFGYTGASYGDALTPSGMVQLDFCGITTADSRWVKCERWFADTWSSRLAANNVYAYYALAKAMRLAKPAPVVTFTSNGFDWYRGRTSPYLMGLAEKVSNQLIASSSWDYYGANLGTAWCVIILRPTLFAEAPIACFTARPNPTYVSQPVEFDPRCSGHSETGKGLANLVKFEWDWDNDGVYDQFTLTPDVVTHSFGCASLPCSYPVTLRVTDDSVPPRTATFVSSVVVSNPPHPPVSKPKEIFMVSLCDGDTLTLDGSDSFDPDEGQHQAGCGTCPNDTITAWAWDLTGAPWTYTDASGKIVNLGTGYRTYFPTANLYNLGLRVTDNTLLAYPGSGQPNLTDEAFSTLYVYNGCACDVTATPQCNAVRLAWTDLGGGAEYHVLRSFAGPNWGFADILTTTETSATVAIPAMDQGQWYRLLVLKSGQWCMSKAVYVSAPDALCNPIARPGGPYTACVDALVSLDGSASVALDGTIVAYEWDLDNDGLYDDASGATVTARWNKPGKYTVGLKVTSQNPTGAKLRSGTATTTVTIEICQCIDNLVARAKPGKVQLTWAHQADAAGYNIYRSTSPGVLLTPANRIAAGVVTTYATYLDSRVVNGTTYYYKVTKVRGGIEVCYSNEANAKPVAAR